MNAHLSTHPFARFRMLPIVVLTLLVTLIGSESQFAQSPSRDRASKQGVPVSQPKGGDAQVKAEMLRQPLGFEPNRGQADPAVDFVSHGRGYSLLLKGTESTFVTAGNASNPRDRSIDMHLVGANAAVTPRAEKPLPGKSNYLFGNDPSRWVHGVQQFEQVRLANAYLGVDLLYYGNQKQVEHDFIVSPGTDPSQIRMEFSGAASQTIARSGALELKTQSGATVALEKPVAYQTLASGARHTVTADYAMLSDNTVSFRLGAYDHSRSLVIDPVVITYSTYFGGSNQDSVVDLKLDAAGDIYVLMTTDSTDLPVVSQIAGACVGTCGPKNPDTLTNSLNTSSHDFYLAKLDPTGQTLLFSTYIGGSGDDVPGALSLSSDGGIYIAGATLSADFPVVNQYSSALPPPGYGGFPILTSTLTRLSTDGSQILYSSLIGGGLINYADRDGGRYWETSTGSIAAGPNGIVYLLGFAETNNENGGFGNFVDAKNTNFLAGDGTFLAKFDTTKTGYASLLYATTFGQPGDREAEDLWAVALDSKQNVWVFGTSGGGSPPIPTANAVQPICGGGGQCDNTFLFELDPSGKMSYATFLGGTVNAGGGPGIESALSMYIDPLDNIYLTGGTESTDFPIKNGASPTAAGNSGFLTKLSPGALSILYSTYTPLPLYMTGTPNGIAGGVRSSPQGFPVKNGVSNNKSGNYPDTVFQLYDTTQTGDASLLASSYLGATTVTVGQTAAFDLAGQFLFGGYTEATTLPVVNPFQSTCSDSCFFAGNGYPDGFISRVQLQGSSSMTLLPAAQDFGNMQVGLNSAAQTSTLTNTGTSSISLSSGSLSETQDFVTSNNCGSSLAGGASCTVSFLFKPTSTGAFTGTFSIYDLSNPTSPLTVALSGTGVAQTISLTPTTYDYGSVTLGSTIGKTFTLTGDPNSTAPLGLTNYTVSGAGFSLSPVQTNPCSQTTPHTCIFSVFFSPTTAGAATGTLTIVDAAGTQTVALSGTGVAQTISLTPTTYDYGSVTLGSTIGKTFTLTGDPNSTAPLGLTNYTVSGAGFSLSPVQTNPCSQTTPHTCIFSVFFSPTTAGAATGTLTIVDAAGTQTVALSGTGVAQTISLTPTTYDYGSVTLGSTIGKTFTLTGDPNSTAPLGLTNYTVSGAGFSLSPVQTNPCSQTTPHTCIFSVFFSPTTAGAATGTLTIVDAAGTQTVALSGTGVAQTISLTPTTYDYGSVTLGSTIGKTFTLTGDPNSTAPLGLTNYTVSGAGFSLSPVQTNPCSQTTPHTCIFSVFFSPTTAGAATGTLTIVDAAGTQTVALSGTGVAQTISLTPTTYDYGSVTLGSTIGKTFTLTGDPNSTAPLGLTNYTVSGAGFSLSPVQTNPCSQTTPHTCIFLCLLLSNHRRSRDWDAHHRRCRGHTDRCTLGNGCGSDHQSYADDLRLWQRHTRFNDREDLYTDR